MYVELWESVCSVGVNLDIQKVGGRISTTFTPASGSLSRPILTFLKADLKTTKPHIMPDRFNVFCLAEPEVGWGIKIWGKGEEYVFINSSGEVTLFETNEDRVSWITVIESTVLRGDEN